MVNYTIYFRKKGKLTQRRVNGRNKRDAISQARLMYGINPRTKVEAYIS